MVNELTKEQKEAILIELSLIESELKKSQRQTKWGFRIAFLLTLIGGIIMMASSL